MTATDLYAQLSAPFDKHHTDTRGGVKLTYITGEQVATRLNTVLGVGGWSFRVLEHGVREDADEMWVLSELTAKIGEDWIVRQQFGSDKIQRSRANGSPLDIGFDLKSAATDGMKKCASLIGIGLYLSEKQGGAPAEATSRPAPKPAPRAAAPTQAPHAAQMVTSEDDPMWVRWAALAADAKLLKLKMPAIEPPIRRQLLQAEGVKLRESITARRAQITVDTDAHPRYQVLRERIEAIGAGGEDPTPFLLDVPCTLAELEDKIAAAERFIEERFAAADGETL